MVSQLLTQPIVQAQIKENTKLHITGLCEGNSPVTGEFPVQRASNVENVSIVDVVMTSFIICKIWDDFCVYFGHDGLCYDNKTWLYWFYIALDQRKEEKRKNNKERMKRKKKELNRKKITKERKKERKEINK